MMRIAIQRLKYSINLMLVTSLSCLGFLVDLTNKLIQTSFSNLSFNETDF